VVAVAIELLARQAEKGVQLSQLTSSLGLVAAVAVAAEGGAARDGWNLRPVFSRHQYDTARRAAVKRRAGATQDLDSLGGCEVDAVELGLSVGQSERDPVDYQADAADPKSGECAKAPNGDARVLGEVALVLDEDARNSAQRFREGQLALSALDGFPIHDPDRSGNFQ